MGGPGFGQGSGSEWIPALPVLVHYRGYIFEGMGSYFTGDAGQRSATNGGSATITTTRTPDAGPARARKGGSIFLR